MSAGVQALVAELKNVERAKSRALDALHWHTSMALKAGREVERLEQVVRELESAINALVSVPAKAPVILGG